MSITFYRVIVETTINHQTAETVSYEGGNKSQATATYKTSIKKDKVNSRQTILETITDQGIDYTYEEDATYEGQICN